MKEQPKSKEIPLFTEESTIAEVAGDPAFRPYGRLLFPTDLSLPGNMTLRELSSSRIYLWYSHIRPEKTVEIVNRLKLWSLEGKQIFFPIYTEREIAKDPSKRNAGLFFFPGEEGREFAVMNAGGGFYYVGAMHDSFPHAVEASGKGYNAFALIYRTEDPFQDLGRAIAWIWDHSDELKIRRDGYSLWGGSAGARMAAALGNREILRELTGRRDISQAAAVIMQYTGYTTVSPADAPTYACVGTRDGIADWRGMKRRLEKLNRLGIPTEFHSYEGLGHGFGLGMGTWAEGWIRDAFAFWDRQIMK